MAAIYWKEGWKCVSTMFGEPSVAVDLVLLKQGLLVES